jgi:hypothetical protein
VAVDDVLAVGEVVQVHEALLEPLLVRTLLRELGLHLLVADDASLRGVDEEHLPGLEAALLHDTRGIDVDDAGLAGHDHAVVVGDPVPARPQAVAVEDRTDHGAVGERDRRRAVPRLHERGVVPVEGALLRRHRGVVLPRLGDHHEHAVPDGPTTEVEQLEALVEARGVGRARRDDRERALEVRDERRLHQRFARPHPVAVALERVDLAVVREVAVRVRERPRRERVRGEPAVHERERGLEALVTQVGEELGELRRGEHSLVDECPAGERREVDRPLDLVLAPLAQHEQLAVEIDAGAARRVGHEAMPEARHHAPRRRPDHRVVGGHGAPADDAQALVGGEALDGLTGGVGLGGVGREEREADAIGPGRGQRERRHGAEERVRDLYEDPGAVAGVHLSAGRPPVVEAAQGPEGGLDDRAALATLHVDDERDAARVVLEAGVVETLGLGNRAERQSPVFGWTTMRHRLRHAALIHSGNRWTQRDDVGPAAAQQG